MSEKRRLPRLSLTTEQFRLDETGKVFSVIDLSFDGMALRVLNRDDLICFTVGREVRGFLNLRREKFQLAAQVRRVAGDVVGLEFSKLSETTRSAIDRFLDPAALGRELRLIPNQTENAMLWYHGPTGADLLLWLSPSGEWTRFSLYLHGIYVQWSRKGQGATGSIQSTGSRNFAQNGLFWLDTLELHADAALDPAKIDIAKRLILSSKVPEEMKTWCVRHLACL